MTTETLEARQQALRNDAIAEGRAKIRAALAALEARFPRHRFRYIDGMGTMQVYCLPALPSDHSALAMGTAIGWGLGSISTRAPALEAEVSRAYDAIAELAANIGDTYKVDFGEVTTTPDADEAQPDADATPREKIAAAMAALGLTVNAVFVPWSASCNAKEKHRSLNWRVTVQRNGRDVLTTDYVAGLAHAPAYNAPVATYGHATSMLRATALEMETETGFKAISSVLGSRFTQSRHAILPDAVDVVWSLSRDCDVLDAGGFEEWAGDLGYDADSRAAEAIYRACLDIALKLRGAIGDAGMEALRVAGEDF